MSFDKKKIGAKIAELRKSRKMTQEQLAEKVGVTVQYLGTMERGKANTTLNRLDKIAEVLGCSTDEFIFFTTSSDNAAASISAENPEMEKLLLEAHEFQKEFIIKIQNINKS